MRRFTRSGVLRNMLDLAQPLLDDARPSRHTIPRKLAVGALILLSTAVTFVFWRSNAPPTALHVTADYWHGTSLGGWLVLEINPSARSSTSSPDVRPFWMFDQIFAASELDFVSTLRAEQSDAFAVRTMRNHWEHYITDEMIDAAVDDLGVNAVRIPVGYWITDAPVGGASPLEYGFTHEGFVSGGLNHLQAMLPKLRARGVVALIDVHALPCNSACVSDGIDCANPLAFTDEPVDDILRCTGTCVTSSQSHPNHHPNPNPSPSPNPALTRSSDAQAHASRSRGNEHAMATCTAPRARASALGATWASLASQSSLSGSAACRPTSRQLLLGFSWRMSRRSTLTVTTRP